MGISLAPYMAAVAFLGVGLAGLAGVMLAPIFSIHPAMGAEIITSAFVVVVIGGLELEVTEVRGRRVLSVDVGATRKVDP